MTVWYVSLSKILCNQQNQPEEQAPDELVPGELAPDKQPEDQAPAEQALDHATSLSRARRPSPPPAEPAVKAAAPVVRRVAVATPAPPVVTPEPAVSARVETPAPVKAEVIPTPAPTPAPEPVAAAPTPAPVAASEEPVEQATSASKVQVVVAGPDTIDLPVPMADVDNPCDNCRTEPCRSGCPVGAIGEGPYDVPACIAHISTAAGRDCLTRGCLARRACPIGVGNLYPTAQAEFHMRAFLKKQLLA